MITSCIYLWGLGLLHLCALAVGEVHGLVRVLRLLTGPFERNSTALGPLRRLVGREGLDLLLRDALSDPCDNDRIAVDHTAAVG